MNNVEINKQANITHALIHLLGMVLRKVLTIRY